MTYNRTTELREKLTERGVKWWPMHDDNGEYSEDRDTEFVIDGKKYTYHEWGEWSSINGITTEQAIAATLGSEREKALEELVQDVWAEYSAKAESSFHPVWRVDGELARRMAAFGFKVVN